MSELPDMRPMRILLVDDHADTLSSLTFYLEDFGHKVTAARTVSEAVLALSAERFDVLLSDIGLPDGTGWDILAQAGLRQPPYTIAMSGFGMSADSARSHQAGYRHHLLKPFKMTDLYKLLLEAASLRTTE